MNRLHILNTIAEKTRYWFMYGRRYSEPPQHYNCRCVVELHIPQPQPWKR